MSDFDDLNKLYEWYTDHIPVKDNLNLDKDKPIKEILISCICGAQWITEVNGEQPIPPTNKLNQKCGNCGKSVQEGCTSIAGHSGGVFNAISFLPIRE